MLSKISNSFDNAADSYDRHARLQQKSCAIFLAKLDHQKPVIAFGTALEVGCGTGILTEHLLMRYPGYPWKITDLSSEMLIKCQLRCTHHRKDVSYQLMDAEKFASTGSYACIFSALVAHWFQNIPLTIKHFSNALVPGGMFAFSFVESGSFNEWRDVCMELSIPYTGNRFPTIDEVICQLDPDAFQVDTSIEEITLSYDSAIDFFRTLKQTGCALNTSGKKHSGFGLRQVIEHWRQVTVTFKIAFVFIKSL